MATIKNYFSTRLSISQIRAHVGASPILTIQRLDGLSVVDLPISKMPAQGDASFVSRKNDITMNVDGGNNYTGSVYVQDPNVAPVGVSIPPSGTIGYFAKDNVPDGWIEVGNPQEFFLFERQVGGTWMSPIYANTEYTEIYTLLNDWGLVRSTSRTVQGRAFNTQDPFKGYFIRCLNPDATGVDPNHTIFDTESDYLSLHKHEGETLYQYSGAASPFVGGAIDRGDRSQVSENFGAGGAAINLGADIWFNYKWKVNFNWDVENDGTIKITYAQNGNTSPVKYLINYDDHIHGQIKTYYRGFDGLHGKLTTHNVLDPNKITRAVATSGRDATAKLTGSLSDDIDSTDQEYTYYNPYRTAGLPTFTFYSQVSAHYTRSFFSQISYAQTRHSEITQELTNTTRGTRDYTSEYSNGVFIGNFPDNTQGSPDNTNTNFIVLSNHSNNTYINTQKGSVLTYADYLERYTLKGASTAHKRIRLDYRYYPYHVLESNPGTPSGSEFYNTGDYGLFSKVTTAAGNHSHNHALLDGGGNPVVKGRGQGHENRPTNVALKMCVKY